MMVGHSYSEMCRTEEGKRNGRTSSGTTGNLERKTEPRLLPSGYKARKWLLRTLDILFSVYATKKSQALGADTRRTDLGSITYWFYDLG